MILISHQRSGSEWFLRGLIDQRYNGWEIFGDLENLTIDHEKFKNISFDARLAMLKAMPNGNAHKIHISQLTKICLGKWPPIDPKIHQNAPSLVKHLASRNDLYLLRRRNIRETMISFMVSKYNKFNFHGSPNRLTEPFTIPYHDLIDWYRSFTSEFEWAEKAFKYKERFWYEDLLDGSQVPTTVRWSGSRSGLVKRNSTQYTHLIQNFDEVQNWMDDLSMPGNLEIGGA